MKNIYLIIGLLVLTGCTKERKESVWDLYDVRHPVPANSQVPVSQATQYDQYIDNDAYYLSPEDYIVDAD